MSAPAYKIPEGVLVPLNFDRRADVALLSRKTAPHYPFLLWLEWGNARQEWRPLREGSAMPVDWAGEDLTYVIESFAKWTGPPGGLMSAAVESGMMQMEERSGRLGLVLTDFWFCNRHLDRYSGSVQAKGGRFKGLRRQKELADRDARKRLQLDALQGRAEDLFLPRGRTREQQQAAYALILRLDRACGLPTRAEWPAEMVDLAAGIMDRASEEAILAVLDYLVAHRDDPAVVKVPERVMLAWDLVAGEVAGNS